MFSGRIAEVTCPRIAVLGTDGAIGKRTTATILTQALNDRGIKAVLVGTGPDRPHPGCPLRRGARRHPVPVLLGRDGGGGGRGLRRRAPRRHHHRGPGRAQPPRLPQLDLHPARQPARRRHPAARARTPEARRLRRRADADPASEINLIETFADTKVIGLTINHEHMTDAEVTAAITLYELELGIPATDALTRSTDRLVDMVVRAFPELDGSRSPPAS